MPAVMHTETLSASLSCLERLGSLSSSSSPFSPNIAIRLLRWPVIVVDRQSTRQAATSTTRDIRDTGVVAAAAAASGRMWCTRHNQGRRHTWAQRRTDQPHTWERQRRTWKRSGRKTLGETWPATWLARVTGWGCLPWYGGRPGQPWSGDRLGRHSSTCRCRQLEFRGCHSLT